MEQDLLVFGVLMFVSVHVMPTGWQLQFISVARMKMYYHTSGASVTSDAMFIGSGSVFGELFKKPC